MAHGEGNLSNGVFKNRTGEVTASPTANTILGRLKDLLTGIVLAAGGNIIGKVGIDQTTPGTTNAVSVSGTVTANLAAGTNNIGDVDVLSIAAGDNNIGNVDIVTVPAPLSTTGGGTEAAALRVTVANDSTGVLSVDDNGASLTIDGGVTVSGPTAADSALTVAPVTVGGLAKATALPTAVSDADVVNRLHDKFGREVVLIGGFRDLLTVSTVTTITNTTETTILAAAASTFNDIYAIVLNNTSGTAVRVDIRDTTGGTIRFPIYLPAGDVRGIAFGGFAIPQSAVNTNWTAQLSASVTDVRISTWAIKNL